MNLSRNNLLALYQVAISAATEAGQFIAERANQLVTVKHKNGGDSLASKVVTEVDLASEAIILKWLKPTCEQYELALLTEETTDDGSRLQMDNFWCVDPLDGTLCFIEKTAGYAVSIALVSGDGTPLIGVVYDPVSGTLYSAVKGVGAMRNDQPWMPALTDPIQGKVLTLVCDRGLLQRGDYPQIKQLFEKIGASLGLSGVKTIEKGAGAVMNAIWVIENQPACYFKLPKPESGGGNLWDFAASAAIFHELNAIASDFHGQSLDLNQAESTFMNLRGVMFTSHKELLA